MRLDCFLSRNTDCSRKSVKKYILQSKVKINGTVCLDVSYKIKEDDVISLNDIVIDNIKNHVIVLNKPENYISSMVDERYPSLMRLIDSKYHKTYRLVGRLDYDTTGLIFLTDNGILNARLTSPKYEIEKKYLVKVNHLLKDSLVSSFSEPNDIGRGEITKPAKLEIIDSYSCYITIKEGKYHEIKRLFGKYNYDVISLKRVAFGPIELKDLEIGKYRVLSEEEYISLLRSVKMKVEEYL